MVRSRFEGTAPMLVGASVFFIVGCLFLVGALTGPTRVQWTGRSVQGTERGGIVYYSYNGQNYSLDSTSRFMSNTVYFDPSDPHSAMLGNAADRVLDIVTVAGPYAIATIILVVGTSRRIRRRRARRRDLSSGTTASFGQGLDPALVRRLIERNAK